MCGLSGAGLPVSVTACSLSGHRKKNKNKRLTPPEHQSPSPRLLSLSALLFLSCAPTVALLFPSNFNLLSLFCSLFYYFIPPGPFKSCPPTPPPHEFPQENEEHRKEEAGVSDLRTLSPACLTPTLLYRILASF